MENNHQDQMLNYSNLDDFFDKSIPQSTAEFSLYPTGDHMINTEQSKDENVATPDTEALKNQVIEKLAALIPDENNPSKIINQQGANTNNASESLKKFMFDNGSNNYSDEINF